MLACWVGLILGHGLPWGCNLQLVLRPHPHSRSKLWLQMTPLIRGMVGQGGQMVGMVGREEEAG